MSEKNSSQRTDRVLPDQVVDALVTAIFAVNGYTLEKVWTLLPRFREEGLTRPDMVVSHDIGGLTVRLANAGYNRGIITDMFAERLQGLMRAIVAGHLDDLPDAVRRNDSAAAQRMLREVRGVGPHVARNAWLLLKPTNDGG